MNIDTWHTKSHDK